MKILSSKYLIMKFLFLLFSILLSFKGITQEIPVHISTEGIYDFLDEMAILNIIDVNDAIKPYSDKFIYLSLKEVQSHKTRLNNRQQNELEFYLEEFSYFEGSKKLKSNIPYVGNILDRYNLSLNPPSYSYKDSLFFIDIRPIWGIIYNSNQKGTNFHRWGGAALKMNMGENFGAWASVRDNNVSEILTKKEFFTKDPGGTFKGRADGGGDFSEMRGGISYSWNFGSISMVKDHVEWGTNSNGANILSSKPPSFAQLKFHLKPTKWFEFNYLHGWLVSNVIDSTRSYTTSNGKRRDVMHPKYIAANMFTFTPFKKIHLSFGNSIIYSDMNPHPAYLIPFMFFKSVDHWLNNTDGVGRGVGQNSQMFANFSVFRLKNLHLYGSIFIDELKIARFKEPGKFNFYSYKYGFEYANGFIKNLSFGTEYTRSTPGTYQHYISTTTFESNGYNLGHYLRENSEELYFFISYKPISKLKISAEYTKARHGNTFDYINGSEAITHPFMQEVKWQNKSINIMARYEFVYNSFLKVAFLYNESKGEDLTLFTPNFYQGKNNTISFGFNLGF